MEKEEIKNYINIDNIKTIKTNLRKNSPGVP